MQQIILKEVQTNYDDLRFGIIDILVDENTSKLYMRKVKKSEDQDDFLLSQKQSLKRLSINHPNLLKMSNVESDEQNLTIYVYFEYPNEDLYDRKENLQNTTEFVKFFNDIIAGLAALEKQKMVHGNLKPEYIFFDGENYVIKDRLADTSTSVEAQINNVKFGENLYQTPQMFETICSAKPYGKYNPFKEEVFNFGMLALSMLIENEEDLQSCYDTQNQKFRQDLFKDLVSKTKRKYFNNEQDKIIGDFLFYGILNPNQKQRFSPRKAHLILKKSNHQSYNSLTSNDQSLTQSNQQITSVGQFYSENDFSAQNERIVESRNKLELKNRNKGQIEYEIDFEEEGNEVQQQDKIVKQNDKTNISGGLEIVGNSGQHKMEEKQIEIQDSQRIKTQIEKHSQSLEHSDKPNVMILKNKKRNNQEFEVIFEDNVNENNIQGEEQYQNKKQLQENLTFDFEDQQKNSNNTEKNNENNQQYEVEQDNENNEKTQQNNENQQTKKNNTDSDFFQTIQINKTKDSDIKDRQQFQKTNGNKETLADDDQKNNFFIPDTNQIEAAQLEQQDSQKKQQNLNSEKNSFEVSSKTDFYQDQTNSFVTRNYSHTNNDNVSNLTKNTRITKTPLKINEDKSNKQIQSNKVVNEKDRIIKEDINFNKSKSIIADKPNSSDNRQQSQTFTGSNKPTYQQSIDLGEDYPELIKDSQKQGEQEKSDLAFFQKNATKDTKNNKLQNPQNKTRDVKAMSFQYTRESRNYGETQGFDTQNIDQQDIQEEQNNQENDNPYVEKLESQEIKQPTDNLENNKMLSASQKNNNTKRSFYDLNCDENVDKGQKNDINENLYDSIKTDPEQPDDEQSKSDNKSDMDDESIKSYDDQQEQQQKDPVVTINLSEQKQVFDQEEEKKFDNLTNNNEQNQTRSKTNTQQINSFYDNLKNYQIDNLQNDKGTKLQDQHNSEHDNKLQQIQTQVNQDNTIQQNTESQFNDKQSQNIVTNLIQQKDTNLLKSDKDKHQIQGHQQINTQQQNIQTQNQKDIQNINEKNQNTLQQQVQVNSDKNNINYQNKDSTNQDNRNVITELQYDNQVQKNLIQKTNQEQQNLNNDQVKLQYSSQPKTNFTQDQLAEIYRKQQQSKVNSQRISNQTSTNMQNVQITNIQRNIQPSRSPARKVTRISIEGRNITPSKQQNDAEKFNFNINQKYQKQGSMPLKQDFGQKYKQVQTFQPLQEQTDQRSKSQKISIQSSYNLNQQQGSNLFQNSPTSYNYINSQNNVYVQNTTNMMEKQSITTQNSTQQNYPGSQHYRPSQFSQRQNKPTYQQVTYSRQNRSPSPNYRQIAQQNNIHKYTQNQNLGVIQQSVYDSKYNSQYVEPDQNKESIENLLRVENDKFRLVKSEYQRVRVIKVNFKVLLRKRSTTVSKKQFHSQMIVYKHEIANFQQRNYKRFLMVARNYGLVQHKFTNYIEFITSYYGIQYNRTQYSKVSEKMTVYTRRVEINIENNKIYNNYKHYTEGPRNTRQSVVTQQSFYPSDYGDRIHVSNYQRQERSIDLKNEKKFGSKSPIRIKRITEEEYNNIRRNSQRSKVTNQSNRTVVQHPDLQKYKIVSNKSNQTYQHTIEQQNNQNQKDSIHFTNIEGNLVQSKGIVTNKIYNPGEELILSQESTIQNSQYSFYNENKLRSSQMWNQVKRGPYKKIANIHYIKNIINEQGISESKTDLMEKFLPTETDDLIHLKDENGMKIYKYNSKKYIFKK